MIRVDFASTLVLGFASTASFVRHPLSYNCNGQSSKSTAFWTVGLVLCIAQVQYMAVKARFGRGAESNQHCTTVWDMSWVMQAQAWSTLTPAWAPMCHKETHRHDHRSSLMCLCRVLPAGEPIDLASICFHAGCSPDRLSALDALAELQTIAPTRSWRFIAVDASLDDFHMHKQHIICELGYYLAHHTDITEIGRAHV